MMRWDSGGLVFNSPQLIYLDQSDLSHLALGRLPEEAALLKDLCNRGQAMPVFSFTHTIETWKLHGTDTQSRIVSLVDSFAQRLWNLPRFTFEVEVASAFFHWFGLAFNVNPLKKSINDFYYAQEKGPLLIQLKEPGFADILRLNSQNAQLSAMLANLTWMPGLLPEAVLAFRRNIKVRGTRSVMRVYDEKFGRFLIEYVPERFPSGDFVPLCKRQAFIGLHPWRDYATLPMAYIWSEVGKLMARGAAGNVKPSQLMDFEHLSALPYVDYFLCDRQTFQLLKIAKIPNQYLSRVHCNLKEALHLVAQAA